MRTGNQNLNQIKPIAMTISRVKSQYPRVVTLCYTSRRFNQKRKNIFIGRSGKKTFSKTTKTLSLSPGCATRRQRQLATKFRDNSCTERALSSLQLLDTLPILYPPKRTCSPLSRTPARSGLLYSLHLPACTTVIYHHLGHHYHLGQIEFPHRFGLILPQIFSHWHLLHLSYILCQCVEVF
jgi:hypothetical protein